MSSLVRLYCSDWYHNYYPFISWNGNTHEPGVWLVRSKHSLMYWTAVNPSWVCNPSLQLAHPKSMQELCSLGTPPRAVTDWPDSSEHRHCRFNHRGWWLPPGVLTSACLLGAEGGGRGGGDRACAPCKLWCTWANLDFLSKQERPFSLSSQIR